jgi:hypothetical protein
MILLSVEMFTVHKNVSDWHFRFFRLASTLSTTSHKFLFCAMRATTHNFIL